jgi:ribonuclease D
MSEQTLVDIAKAKPGQLQDLKPIQGMTPNQISRHGQHILQAVARGAEAPNPRPLRVEHQNEDVLERYEALRKWRKTKAQARGVESDIIIPRDVLMEIARRAPVALDDLETIPGLGPTRREKYGQELLDLLKRFL